MLEVYSKNVTVAEDSDVPFNNAKLIKGCYESLLGAGSLQFNHCGVYHLTCNGSVSGTGDLTIQVNKNGVPQPETVTPITGTADADIPFAIDTFIQVPNSGRCCCQTPVEITIHNAGVEAVFALIDVKVVKVC